MAEVEDVDHVLRRCPAAFMVWTAIIKPSRVNDFLAMEFKEWLRINLTVPDYFVKVGTDWDLLFAVVLWNLWTARNEVIFQNSLEMHESILDRCRQLQGTMLKAIASVPVMSTRGRDPSSQRSKWSKPARGWCKVNIDGGRSVQDGITSFVEARRQEDQGLNHLFKYVLWLWIGLDGFEWFLVCLHLNFLHKRSYFDETWQGFRNYDKRYRNLYSRMSES
ncbi:hypothetical protein GQ457_14G019980 [Hibiscus cannabinus]